MMLEITDICSWIVKGGIFIQNRGFFRQSITSGYRNKTIKEKCLKMFITAQSQLSGYTILNKVAKRESF
jgi:hypothetical protein